MFEGRRPQQHGTADQVDPGEAGPAVGAQVVADDKAAVRPADEDGIHDAPLLDDHRQVVRPQPRVSVDGRIEWLLGHAVTADVEGHHPEALGQRTGDLPAPAHGTLRPTVHEHHRGSVRIAPFVRAEHEAATPADLVLVDGLHDDGPSKIRRDARRNGYPSFVVDAAHGER